MGNLPLYIYIFNTHTCVYIRIYIYIYYFFKWILSECAHCQIYLDVCFCERRLCHLPAVQISDVWRIFGSTVNPWGTRVRPPKTIVTIENPPWMKMDVLLKLRDFPMSCLIFRGCIQIEVYHPRQPIYAQEVHFRHPIQDGIWDVLDDWKRHSFSWKTQRSPSKTIL